MSKKLAIAIAAALLGIGGGMAGAFAGNCPGNKEGLGVSRVVEIDTTGGPGFGFEHYKAYDFLAPGEVVLTFDDGPLPQRTVPLLEALRKHCVKATFFPTGKQAFGYPEVLRQVARDGHTIGSHTWTHPNLPRLVKKKGFLEAEKEIESTISAVRFAVKDSAAPFFRFPQLKDSPELLDYLAKRNLAVFSTDIDSFDFKIRSEKRLISRLFRVLKKKGKGILLFHDIQPATVRAMPKILKMLKDKGYRVVHLTAKAPVSSLPKYDKELKSKFKGRLANAGGRPMSAVIRTVSGTPPPGEQTGTGKN